jgi:hypothetical protein
MVALVDTLSIYEQFRAALGEEKAKVFAQTLGMMIEEAKNAATKDDIRLVRESLDANTARADAALATLAEAQVRAEARLAGVENRLAGLEAVVAELVAAIKGLAIHSDRDEGMLLLRPRTGRADLGRRRAPGRATGLTPRPWLESGRAVGRGLGWLTSTTAKNRACCRRARPAP